MADTSVLLMKEFAGRQTARIKRLTAVRDRLEAKLGTADPKVAALTKTVESGSAFAQELSSIASRTACRPKIEAGDAAVYGQVVDSQGNAMPLLRVRMADSAGKLQVAAGV